MAEFCESAEHVIAAVRAFSAGSPALQRDALGSNARYFVHLRDGRRHVFALSKFCAFRGIRLRTYRAERVHDETGGTEARTLISKLTGEPWVPLRKSSRASQQAFGQWFETLPGSEAFDTSRFWLLEISADHFAGVRIPRAALRLLGRVKTPEQLAAELESNAATGRAGEAIAFRYEVKRLKALGVVNARDCVEHVALKNVSEGYDIFSRSDRGGVRRIEVKASTGDVSNGFFISAGEVSVLEAFGNHAYLYLVEVSDVARCQGRVVVEIQNPVPLLKSSDSLEPTVYRGSFRREKVRPRRNVTL